MYSFSHQSDGDATGLPQYPHFADILKTLKGHTATRLMLDGQAACDCLRGEEQHEHRMRRTLWESLRRLDPHEYERQVKEQGRKNSERLLAMLRAHDPLFGTAWRMLEHMLEILPDTAEYLVKKGTHDDPAKFLELYEEMREWAQEVEHRKHRRKSPTSKANAGHERERADGREAKRRADRAALVVKVKSGRAEEGDLMRYLELTMPDDPEEAGSAGGR